MVSFEQKPYTWSASLASVKMCREKKKLDEGGIKTKPVPVKHPALQESLDAVLTGHRQNSTTKSQVGADKGLHNLGCMSSMNNSLKAHQEEPK